MLAGRPGLAAATRVRFATVAARVQLEFRLVAPEVASLADPQLDQPCQPVLHHHPLHGEAHLGHETEGRAGRG